MNILNIIILNKIIDFLNNLTRSICHFVIINTNLQLYSYTVFDEHTRHRLILITQAGIHF